MAQLKLFEIPKPPRVAPIAILVVSLIIGIVLGGVAADTLLRERVKEVVILEEGRRPERSTTIVGIKEDKGEAKEVILATLTVQLIENGRGRILLRIDPTYFEEDTQRSAENAFEAVSRYYILSTVDVVFIFESQEELIIRGPSAGAAMAITLYALAKSVGENKVWVVDNSTVVSGMITSDGKVLPIGEANLKAQKVWQEGFKRFVVSSMQGDITPPLPDQQFVKVKNLDELVNEVLVEVE